MNVITVRGMKIGDGIPKICVPITGNTTEEILEEAKCIYDIPSDFVEWRVDCFEYCHHSEKVLEVLEALRKILGNKPLLFTFRTNKEGGNAEISKEEYRDLLISAICGKDIDLVDIEFFSMKDVREELIEQAKNNQVFMVASNHDFEKTPKEEELLERWCAMQEQGADILKIAAMPRNMDDVFTMWKATEKMTREFAKQPVVGISMSKLGLITRIAPELFGSAFTFGVGKKASAPGQIRTEELQGILSMIHKNL